MSAMGEAGRHEEREAEMMLPFVQMRAVVICFNTTPKVRGVDMEGI